ncbi:coatomer epsilon subunit-domain-containing protein [Peziza echinospora]|nr:coatomer epsilon subunit-domain-containing protein [Peziza echinospora]
MDPFSSEGELLAIHNAFHQGLYQTVVEEDTSSLSKENVLTAKVLKLRARIALGEAEEVEAELDGDDTPELAAVKALAQYKAGSAAEAAQAISELVAAASDNATVQIIGGIILHLDGKSDDAVALLSKHQGSLEAVSLIVQIRLTQNRTDLALKEVQAAKRWAQDSLLVNLAESWVGLRVGGEKYQQAYYVFEELAQAPSTSTASTLVGQAVAELHLGRLDEAEVALQQALEKDPKHEEALVNSIVLSLLAGKDYSDKLSFLNHTAPQHPFLLDFEQKNELFDKAASKYTPKVAA